MKHLWWFVENIITVSFIHQELLCAHHWHWAEGHDIGVRVRDRGEDSIVLGPGTHSLDHFWYP